MRKKIIAGNWKMNTDINSGLELAKTINESLKNLVFNSKEYGVVIAPPFTHLYAVSKVIDNKFIQLSAQNIADNEKGAFTGEVSVDMIKSAGATATILGHSERRTYYGENSSTLSKKLNLAIKNNILPIFCIGEILAEREKEIHFNVVEKQVSEVLFNLTVEDFSKVVIAYEPVWAIGTGKVATPEQAQEMHEFIRNLIEKKYSKNIAQYTTILYGGSCSPSNAEGLFSKPDIDGGLIGGASLKAEDFLKLIEIRLKH